MGQKLVRRSSQSGQSHMDESKLIEITRPGDGQSLCRTCYWAHAQKGFRESQEAIFCMFGPMRKVPFRVRDCTDYMNRTLPTRDQMEKIALIIPTEPVRKKLGFSGVGFSNGSEEEDLIASMEQSFAGGDRSRLLRAVGLRSAAGGNAGTASLIPRR